MNPTAARWTGGEEEEDAPISNSPQAGAGWLVTQSLGEMFTFTFRQAKKKKKQLRASFLFFFNLFEQQRIRVLWGPVRNCIRLRFPFFFSLVFVMQPLVYSVAIATLSSWQTLTDARL